MRSSTLLLACLASLCVLTLATPSPLSAPYTITPLDYDALPEKLGWGMVGHWMTGAIAQHFVSGYATMGLKNLLPETQGDMGAVASWADTQARDQFPWSPPLHYADTPAWECNYDRRRDCLPQHGVAEYCVDGAIQNYTSRVMDSSLSLDERNIALKFLIHFIGDIHQPLHVGFTEDAGGNAIAGTFDGHPSRKLHAIWDTDMIEKRVKEDFGGNKTEFKNYIVDKMINGVWKYELEEWRTCPSWDQAPADACSQNWASESIKLACTHSYTDHTGQKVLNGFNLGADYFNHAMPVIEERLARSGIRMAQVVNSMFKQASMDVFAQLRE